MPISELKTNPIKLINVIIANTHKFPKEQRSRIITEVGKIVKKYDNRGTHVDLDSFTDDILSSMLNPYFPAIDVTTEKTFFPDEPEGVVEAGKNYQLRLREALRKHCEKYLTT